MPLKIDIIYLIKKNAKYVKFINVIMSNVRKTGEKIIYVSSIKKGIFLSE